MKIEKLSNKKSVGKGILIGFVISLIFVIIVSLFTSKAKYENTESVKIVEGKVNYVVPDLNVMAVYLKNDKEYVTSKEIPKSGYVLSSDSYCTVPDNKEKIKEDITYKDGKVYIGINKKGTKCYIYFNSLADETLAKLKQKSNGNKESFDGIADTNEGIYSAPDGMYGGISYYYRGSVENNYVHFAGFYWRIIRINGDGTLRLIYDGTIIHKNGDPSVDRQLTENNSGRTIIVKGFNETNDKIEYVGLKYTEENAHGYDIASTILGNDNDETTLYGWYKANLSQYDNKIDQNGLFCSDRVSTTTISQTWEDWKKTKTDAKATGSTTTYYGARMRFYPNGSAPGTQTPTLECIGGKNDIFSKTGVTKGNESLTYPVGLITADEVVFAGGFGGSDNTSYYLYTGRDYWTMSPSYFGGSYPCVFLVYYSGHLTDGNVKTTRGIRPVINLKADYVKVGSGTGDPGTISNPYEVS